MATPHPRIKICPSILPNYLYYTKETEMTYKQKVILMRFVRSAAAMVVTAFTAWVAGPDAAELVGSQAQTLIVAVGVPLLISADKWLRYGSDDDDMVEEV